MVIVILAEQHHFKTQQRLTATLMLIIQAECFKQQTLIVISTNEINFSLQSNRADDPTTSSIALQLNDNPAGVTMNRAVTNNFTFNSIGNRTAEANLNVWGDLLFQHSSGIKETLNGSDYDLDIRKGDTDRAINLLVGAIGSN